MNDDCASKAGARRMRQLALLLSVAAVSLVGPLAVVAKAAAFEFPSSSSTVVAGPGAPSDSVGYFWSVSRGDKVSQTFSGPPSIDHVKLVVEPVFNNLAPEQQVNWTLSINGVDIDSFVVPTGATGPIVVERSFPLLTGPNYGVQIRVTNEIPGGGGSHTLASTGSSGQHSIDLSNTPPQTLIASGPESVTASSSATFAFGSPQLDTTGFQCSIDHTNFVPCVSPRSYGALSVGPHSFEVSAIDSEGNVDPTPATWQWTVAAPLAPVTKKAKALKCKKGFRKVKKKNGKTVCKRKPAKKVKRGQR